MQEWRFEKSATFLKKLVRGEEASNYENILRLSAWLEYSKLFAIGSKWTAWGFSYNWTNSVIPERSWLHTTKNLISKNEDTSVFSLFLVCFSHTHKHAHTHAHIHTHTHTHTLTQSKIKWFTNSEEDRQIYRLMGNWSLLHGTFKTLCPVWNALTHFTRCSISTRPENARKPLIFWHFQGV